MRNIRDNRLLLVSLGLLVAYWVFAPMLPKPYVSSVMSLLSLLAGVLTFSRYVEQTYWIVWHGDRSAEGGHWAIYGAFLISVGTIWSGGYSLLWVYFGQPEAWTASAFSSFGRGLVAIGFWLMAFSPDASRIIAGYPVGFYRMLFMLASVLIAFIAGTHFSNFN